MSDDTEKKDEKKEKEKTSFKDIIDNSYYVKDLEVLDISKKIIKESLNENDLKSVYLNF
jgi:hypothetical protein